MKPSFKDFPLRLLNPSFDSDLLDVLTELEILRHLELKSDVHPYVFMQLKSIFHMLESLGSARIEGNHTTLADYVESHLQAEGQGSEQLEEIKNIETAMLFIESTLQAGDRISERFIRELHALAVSGLAREGDKTPGQYRHYPVSIAQSVHLPPDAVAVPGYMQELVAFINQEDKPKYDLMKIALAHHRFGWIHPFGNGNGRTVRLLTYALLIKYGFNVQASGRLLNPTAVFCSDRNRYYAMLARADQGHADGLEDWCTYVLSGISRELKKVDNLASNRFLNDNILLPAIRFSLQRQYITDEESRILRMAVTTGEFKAGDLRPLFPNATANQRTYQIKKLLDQGFISPLQDNARVYIPNFGQSLLLRGVVDALRQHGFIGGLD